MPTLREFLDQSATLMDALQEGVIVYDPQFNYMYWSSGMEAITGISRDDILGQNALQKYPLAELGLKELLQQARAGKVTASDIVPCYFVEKRQDARLRFSYSPWFDDSGRVGAVIASVQDVSDLVELGKGLSRQRGLFNNILQMATDAIICVDQDGKVLYWNRAASRLFGWTQATMLGSSMEEIIPSELLEEHRASFREAVREGKLSAVSVKYETAGISKAGDRIPLEISLGSLTVNGGIVFTAILRDISERWVMQQEREFLALAKKQFIQNTAHEFRTPLSIMMGYFSILMDDEYLSTFSAEVVRIVRVMSTQIRSLNTLVENMLVVSKADTVEQLGEGGARNILETLATVCAYHMPVAHQKGLEMVLTIEDELVYALDPFLAQVIFDNLISNAIKFTELGEVAIAVASDNESVYFRISDTGIGIPEHSKDLIWKRFYQVDGGTTRRYPGVGLGLAVVKRAVDLIGGSIELTSELGKGTTIIVKFPWDKEAVSDDSF